jgi:hypothetical protein
VDAAARQLRLAEQRSGPGEGQLTEGRAAVTARRPSCGNDSPTRLGVGDQAVVDAFQQYLVDRRAAEAALPAALHAAGQQRWRVYGYDAGQWGPVGSATGAAAEAEAKRIALVTRFPYMPTVVVRESTTYTAEEQQ